MYNDMFDLGKGGEKTPVYNIQLSLLPLKEICIVVAASQLPYKKEILHRPDNS
jgi:hypothetical protein